MTTATLAKNKASLSGEVDPVRAAQARIAKLVLTIVALGVCAIGAMAATDAFDPNFQWLSALRQAPETVAGSFGLCAKSQTSENCVLDGDLYQYRGQRVRVAGIDAPHRIDDDCAAEAALGETSARKLQALLNAGPYQTFLIPTKNQTNLLNALRRDGEYFADQLIDAGLARRRILFRRSWCP